MDKKTKILFAIWSLEGGGAEKALVNLVNNLDRDKFEITVFCYINAGVNKQNLSPDINYRFGVEKRFFGLGFLERVLPIRFLHRFFIGKAYDIEVSFLEGFTIRLIAGAPKGTRKISWVHQIFEEAGKYAHYFRNESEMKKLSARFDVTTTVSETAKKRLQEIVPALSNIQVLPNIYETEQVRRQALEAIRDSLFAEDTFNIIAVGSFGPVKGFERLIQAVGEIVKQNSRKVRLYLLGEGKLKDEYLKIINDLQIGQSVVFLGYQVNPSKYMKAADLFVCSSLREGFPNVIVEAMALGVPILSTRCGGPEEMLGADSKYGLLVENSEAGIVGGIQTFLDSPELLAHYRAQSLKRVADFDKESVLPRIESLLLGKNF